MRQKLYINKVVYINWQKKVKVVKVNKNKSKSKFTESEQEKLVNNPEAKSATIALMNPEEDYEGHMPCIISLDFKIRNEQLDITGFFRSQDIGKKIYADILALNAILTEVSEKIKVKSGDVKIFISSAHIYEQDYNKFND